MAGGEAFWQPLGTGIVETIVAGDNVTVDATDPANPIVASSGVVETVVAGTNVTVDATDPANPIVSSSTSATDVMDAGRWEVVVSGVPAEAVMNTAEDDWLYAWAGA